MNVSLLVIASGKGISPRTSASDYDARQSITEATLAAATVPARQIERLFSGEIARQDIVLEVAVYPQSGQTFDVGTVCDLLSSPMNDLAICVWDRHRLLKAAIYRAFTCSRK
jgi:hypothetical protein